MTKLLLVLVITIFLSGCGIKQKYSNLPSATTTPEATTEIITELKTEISATEDIDTLDSFEQDQDDDFSAEFSQLESDLQ